MKTLVYAYSGVRGCGWEGESSDVENGALVFSKLLLYERTKEPAVFLGEVQLHVSTRRRLRKWNALAKADSI